MSELTQLRFRDPVRAKALSAALEAITRSLGREVAVMHVCGSHEQSIARYGLRAAFPRELDVIMGPGCPVCVTDLPEVDEAVALANDTEYGLSAAVFTRDIARGLAVAKRIDSGICHINGPTVADEAQMPFGGVKGSGYGRFGGKAGVDAFTELRWITVQTTPRHYPF